MDSISDADLGGITGQAGVTIAFGGNQTTEVTFDAVSWGDPDGMGGANQTAGWVIFDGTIGISVIIADGEMLTIDVATANGAAYSVGNVTIADGTTFVAIGLPSQTINVDTPSTLAIGLGTSAGSIAGTIGLLNLENLSVSPGTPDALYIYAH
ncbi:MAG: hypothetical protein SWH61_14135 [Thermodesulfobacteriota bacterium]|nr:hypothetical protein [Thermodesulfobacteriota bacterium]